jgi:hypothetical protein
MKIDTSSCRSTLQLNRAESGAALQDTDTASVDFLAFLPCRSLCGSSMTREDLANPVDSQLVCACNLVRRKQTLESSIWPTTPGLQNRGSGSGNSGQRNRGAPRRHYIWISGSGNNRQRNRGAPRRHCIWVSAAESEYLYREAVILTLGRHCKTVAGSNPNHS